MTIVGYARVSTGSPALDTQEAALRAAGAEGVFAEKISGAVTDRKALARAMALGPGDALLVAMFCRRCGAAQRLMREQRELSVAMGK